MLETKTNYVEKCSDIFSRIGCLQEPDLFSDAKTVYEEGIFKLVRFQPVTTIKYTTPLIIVYAFINRPSVLDMHSDISVVRKYLQGGFDVYMIDWGYPTEAEQFIDIDDYIDFIDRCVEKVGRISNKPALNIHGYCLGGSLSAVYASLYPQKVKNLILQATPIDFHTDNVMALWAQNLNADAVTASFKMMPGSFLNAGFLLCDPINLIVNKYDGLQNMQSDKALAGFLRMDKWIFDSPAIPAQAFRQYINCWYHENQLIKGEFTTLERKVSLHDISSPLLVLAADFDHIVPRSSQEAILPLVSSTDKKSMVMKKGHIGITTSSESHREFWPKVVDWLGQRTD